MTSRSKMAMFAGHELASDHRSAGDPGPRAGRARGRSDPDAARPRSRRVRGPAPAARLAPPDRRAVRVLRPLRADGPRAGTGHGRAPAPAHQPGDRDVPVRGRDRPPRQPRIAPADRRRRHQLDDRRARHRAFGAHRSRAARRRLDRARHPAVGRPAARRRGDRAGVSSPRGRHAAVAAPAGRRDPRAGGRGVRPALAGQDVLAAGLRRRRDGGGRVDRAARRRRAIAAPTSSTAS